jgi:hypothetical protein
MSVIYDRKQDNFADEEEILRCVFCEGEIDNEPYIRWEAYCKEINKIKQSRICGHCACTISKGLTLDLIEFNAARDMNVAIHGTNWVRLKRITAKPSLGGTTET